MKPLAVACISAFNEVQKFMSLKTDRCKGRLDAVGHIYADVVVEGSRGEILLRNVIVDVGASYTVLSKEVVEKVGAWPIPYTVRLELGDGRAVEADIYAVIIRLKERSAPTLAACFEGAKMVLGVRTLEDLGLRVDPTSGKLEPTRPAGSAYFYYEM